MSAILRSLALINSVAVMILPLAALSQQAPANPLPDERFKADILVIAPHPDDESTIAGYLAKAVFDEHRRVAVVGENHEHHQAAAVLATEAFDLAGDPTWFPEQVAAPEDHLWYGNLMEGLRVWQPKKLYYYTDASHFDFLKGKGPQYSMTEVSPSQHVSYARLAARELAFHRTQYGYEPAKALATNNLQDYEQPLPFVLAKSLVGGPVTGDIMDGIRSGQIPFAPVRGYRPENSAGLSMELGQGWAFYRRFYPAHNLDVMPGLLAPELGVGGGEHFPVLLLLHNNTDSPVTFHLRTQFPPGWAVDSTSAQHSHP